MADGTQNSPDSQDIQITRRDFLKIGGASAGALLLGKTVGNLLNVIFPPDDKVTQPPKEDKEVLIQIPPPIIVIDIAPPKNSPNIVHRTETDPEFFLKRLLGDKYIDRPTLELRFAKKPDENESVFLKKVYASNPEVAVAYGAQGKIAIHGEMVAGIIVDQLKQHQIETQVELIPLQEVVNPRKEKPIDRLGNQGFCYEITADPIIEQLRKYPSQKIVNLSFQIGTSTMWYITTEKKTDHIDWPPETEDPNNPNIHFVGAVSARTIGNKTQHLDKNGNEVPPWDEEIYQKWRGEMFQKHTKIVTVENPYVKIDGTYKGSNGENNLLELFKICDKFPDKLFFAAGGNNGDDIRELREKLRGRWPKNLVLTAAADSGREITPTNHVYGMDIYFPGAQASSVSTPLIATSAALQQRRGFSLPTIRNILLNTANLVPFSDFNPETNEVVTGEMSVYSSRGFDQ